MTAQPCRRRRSWWLPRNGSRPSAGPGDRDGTFVEPDYDRVSRAGLLQEEDDGATGRPDREGCSVPDAGVHRDPGSDGDTENLERLTPRELVDRSRWFERS